MKKYSTKFIATVAVISILTAGGIAWAAQDTVSERTLESYIRELEEILLAIDQKYPGFWKDYDLANEAANLIGQKGSGTLDGAVSQPSTPDFGAAKLLEENRTPGWYGAEKENKNKNENALPPIPDLKETTWQDYSPQFTPDASSESGGEQGGQDTAKEILKDIGIGLLAQAAGGASGGSYEPTGAQ